MTSDALSSPVFRCYLGILLGLLVVAGGALVVLRFGLRKDIDHAWKAYRGWLIMIPIVFVALLLGRAATIILFTLVSIGAFTEYARATGLYRDWGMTSIVIAGILGVRIV